MFYPARRHSLRRGIGLHYSDNTRRTTYSYTSYNNVAVAREFDFNQMTELRRTETTYETRTEWINRRLLRLPTSVKVFAGGQTAPASRVDYVYDTAGANLTKYTDIIMHDPAFNPSSASYNAATDYRGNVTSVTRYTDAPAGTGAITTTLSYDMAGNVVQETANCCQQRAYTYVKAFEYAYPTQAARGNTGQLKTSANYDFNTGLVRSRTDENNQTTTNDFYTDSLRFYRTDFPNGSYTSNTYRDKL